jgi:hypothetical protein
VSRPVVLGVAALVLGCSGAATGPVFPTSERFPDSPRRPPSFAAEAPLEVAGLVPATGAGAADARVVAMQVPLDSEAGREQVGRFFAAVLQESTRELFPLLAPQASVVSEGNRQPAQALWRARFAQLDYTSLAGRVVAPPQTLRTYTFGSASRAKEDGAPSPAAPGEVIVVARPGPGASWAGKARLFGDVLAFRLREKRSESGESGFEITEIIEDFRLP